MLSPDYGPLPAGAPVWCKAPFDPEGLLSSMSAIVSCFLGLHFGHVLVHHKEHNARLKDWVLMSLTLLVTGALLHVLGKLFNESCSSSSSILNHVIANGSVLFYDLKMSQGFWE